MLAVVLTQLLEASPVPLLYMRSVIQSLSMWPRMVSFVLSILAKLIIKQVWKQAQVCGQQLMETLSEQMH